MTTDWRIPHQKVPFATAKTLYDSREGRSAFVARHFAPIIKSPVLDVGCFKRALRDYLPETFEYTGVDLMGEPDITLNLDRAKLPFGDGEFGTVVCTDVLEHLENIHGVFDELCRVSRANVIISLPNCWHGMWWAFFGQESRGSGKYYGLPAEPPPDRHRWFFCTTEAIEFLEHRSKRNGMELLYLDTVVPYGSVKSRVASIVFGKNHINIAASSVWAIVGSTNYENE